MENKIYTLADLARHVGVSYQTITLWRIYKKLPEPKFTTSKGGKVYRLWSHAQAEKLRKDFAKKL